MSPLLGIDLMYEWNQHEMTIYACGVQWNQHEMTTENTINIGIMDEFNLCCETEELLPSTRTKIYNVAHSDREPSWLQPKNKLLINVQKE